MRTEYSLHDRLIQLAVLTLAISLLIIGFAGCAAALRALPSTPTIAPPASFQPIAFELPPGYKIINQYELGTALAIDLEAPPNSRVSQGLPVMRQMVAQAGRTLRVTIFIQADAETQAQIGFQPDERLGDYMFYLFVQEPKSK